MLIVSSGSPDIELHSATVRLTTALYVCAELARMHCAFYFEPLPFDKARVVVADEHFPLVQNLIRHCE